MYKYATGLVVVFSTITSILLSTTANAALYSRLGGQAVYDDVADLTWLANANAADGLGFGASFNDGRMTLEEATHWVNGLTVNGIGGWRLPTSLQTDFTCSRVSHTGDFRFGSGCRGSEMGNLFYNVLGGSAHTSIVDSHNANFSFFNNFQEAFYWSSTLRPNSTTSAIGFYFHSGYLHTNNITMPAYALAVWDGDIALAPVPVPAAAWLLVSGVLALFSVGRRRQVI